MKKFRFPLERLLALRRAQQDIEQARVAQRAAAVRAIDERKEQARGARQQAEDNVRGQVAPGNHVETGPVGALGPYRARLARTVRRLDSERADALAKLNQQRRQLLEARQRREVLEKFREKAFSDWQNEANREQEALAAELFLAKRNQKPTSTRESEDP